MPTNKSPVDKIFYSNIDHRFNMVSIIDASDTNNFVADNVEMNREEISYTYKTIKILKKRLQREDMCLIMGLDVFLKLESWYNYIEILKEVRIIVVNRPDNDINNIKKMNFEILDRITSNKIDFLRNEKKHIFLFETSSIDISSSQIRSKISQNENLSGLLPGSILSYIKRNKLYTDLY